MVSMISGLLFCDELAASEDGKDGYKLHFNGGRLLGGLVLMAISGTIGAFVI